MTDKGLDMQERGISVNFPSFIGSKQKQMPAYNAEKTRISELQIHMERVIGRGRCYEILIQKFFNTMHDLVIDINSVCMFLTNFDVPLQSSKMSN